MCGIAAVVRSAERDVAPEVIGAMTREVAHRGPDGEGTVLLGEGAGGLAELPNADHRRWRIALGHRRLSILDLSDAGRQPMASPTGRLWITYNGEIYNYVELRRDLIGAGRVFRSGTDTEVILAAYEAWGTD